MNDEIKEILDKAKEISKYGADGKQHTRFFNQFEAKSLLDYITNLQQENENLKKQNDDKTRIGIADHKYASQMEDKVIELQQENERKERLITQYGEGMCAYANRIDKTIEYFKYQLENLDFYEDTKAKMLCAMGITLLQNGSDSQ